MNVVSLSQKRLEKEMDSLKWQMNLSTHELKVLLSILAAMKQKANITVQDVSMNLDLQTLFGNDAKAFERVFASLLGYWELRLPKEQMPRNKEFIMFPTFQTLFEFFLNKLSA